MKWYFSNEKVHSISQKKKYCSFDLFNNQFGSVKRNAITYPWFIGVPLPGVPFIMFSCFKQHTKWLSELTVQPGMSSRELNLKNMDH